jgi:hypothetical protein
MAKRKKTWSYNPQQPKKSKPKISEEMKQYLQEKADEIVEKIFKPQYLLPISEEQRLNQIEDIYTKWYRNYFYFCVKYISPPDSDSNRSSFENKFVRLEYVGDNEFRYSYLRHNGQWNSTFKMPIDKCLEHVALEVPY